MSALYSQIMHLVEGDEVSYPDDQLNELDRFLPNTDTVSPTTITVFHAWLKPLQVRLTRYGQLNLQGDETLIKIPDDELNPVGNARDQIVINSTTYRVLAVRLMSVRTVWECLCRQELV